MHACVQGCVCVTVWNWLFMSKHIELASRREMRYRNAIIIIYTAIMHSDFLQGWLIRCIITVIHWWPPWCPCPCQDLLRFCHLKTHCGAYLSQELHGLCMINERLWLWMGSIFISKYSYIILLNVISINKYRYIILLNVELPLFSIWQKVTYLKKNCANSCQNVNAVRCLNACSQKQLDTWLACAT